MDYKKLLEYIELVAEAHQEHPNQHGKTMRKLPSGEENPYLMHPLWCSVMILAEPKLPKNIREKGALALLFHDVVEDTLTPLPKDLPENVKRLIENMTVPKLPEYNYSSWDLEKQTILKKPIELQLLKLFDKTATLYDMVLQERRFPEWMDIVEKLASNVEKEYGSLNIVTLARALVTKYKQK